MDDMSIKAAAAQQPTLWQQAETGKSAEAVPAVPEKTETKSLAEMMKEAQERAEARRDSLKLAKPTPRYGDAPLEAYSRLNRARSVSEVNAASGYARRRIAQLKGSLHVDSDNAAKIKAAINQLQKAVNRGQKKKQDLNREKLIEQRKVKSKEAEARRNLELRRRRAQRIIRESGYLREAVISDQLASHLTATQMELRQQAQSLSAAAAPRDAAVQQYAETAAPAPAAPAAELSLQG